MNVISIIQVHFCSDDFLEFSAVVYKSQKSRPKHSPKIRFRPVYWIIGWPSGILITSNHNRLGSNFRRMFGSTFLWFIYYFRQAKIWSRNFAQILILLLNPFRWTIFIRILSTRFAIASNQPDLKFLCLMWSMLFKKGSDREQ